MQDTPSLAGEGEEDEQDLIPYDRCDGEVDGDDVLDVIPEERAPGP